MGKKLIIFLSIVLILLVVVLIPLKSSYKLRYPNNDLLLSCTQGGIAWTQIFIYNNGTKEVSGGYSKNFQLSNEELKFFKDFVNNNEYEIYRESLAGKLLSEFNYLGCMDCGGSSCFVNKNNELIRIKNPKFILDRLWNVLNKN